MIVAVCGGNKITEHDRVYNTSSRDQAATLNHTAQQWTLLWRQIDVIRHY